jgi:hypothetical protein
MKILIFALLAAIVISLGSGLFFLTKQDSDPTKLLSALKVRVALSALLIIVLISSFYFGWITP